jgi:hypothetical protein
MVARSSSARHIFLALGVQGPCEVAIAESVHHIFEEV